MAKTKYNVYQFDLDTWIVDKSNSEYCVCSNFDQHEDGEARAKHILALLRKEEKEEQDGTDSSMS
jgi:hypothetical protein